MHNERNGAASRHMVKTKTPGVYKRGNRYVIVWRRNGRQHKEYFDSYSEAREAKGEAMGGKRRKPSQVVLCDYADRWIGSYRGRSTRGFSEVSRTEYRRDLDQCVKPYFGSWRLDAIEAADVKPWHEWLERRECSPRAIRKAKAVLSAMLSDAAEEGTITFNAVRGIPYIPAQRIEPKPKPRDLTAEDLQRFDAAVVKLARADRQEGRTVQPWRLILFPFLAHTGLRISEALGSTWGNIHLGDGPSVTVGDQVYEGQRQRLKSDNAYRTLPLSQGLARALTMLRDETPFAAPGDPVFASSTGTPMRASNIQNRILDPAKELAGIEWPGGRAFHVFRHFAASHLHHEGRSPRQVSDWLGHADPAFTMRTYVGQVGEGLGDAAFLDELVSVPDTLLDELVGVAAYK